MLLHCVGDGRRRFCLISYMVVQVHLAARVSHVSPNADAGYIECVAQRIASSEVLP